MRRSDRLLKRQRINYVDESSSSENDDSETDADDEGVSIELINIIHDAIQRTLQVASQNTTKEESKAKKRKRSTENLPPPPIIPTDLTSLIQLCKLCAKGSYTDCEILPDLLPCLLELDAMIGLDGIKNAMVDFILLHVQESEISMPSMRHLIIAGPPGCGKTTIATIIAKILSVTEGTGTPHVVYGTQGNLIGGFLGQTAQKTEEVVRSAFGGVLIIDEASSLADGRSEQNSDSFSKSCIDTLNRMLSEYGDKFICILAGYKKEIYRDILSINPGMDRRFSTCFEIEKYTINNIYDIIMQCIKTRNMSVVEGALIPLEWIKKNKSLLKNTGGDCNILIDFIITCHARRKFGQNGKNQITQEDINAGLERMDGRLREKSSNTTLPSCVSHMFT
jgi:DNA polymerase III delta prime subunit